MWEKKKLKSIASWLENNLKQRDLFKKCTVKKKVKCQIILLVFNKFSDNIWLVFEKFFFKKKSTQLVFCQFSNSIALTLENFLKTVFI